MGNKILDTGSLGIPGGNAGIEDGNFGAGFNVSTIWSLDIVFVFTSSGLIDILTFSFSQLIFKSFY